jgi:hypothetical protein
MMTNVPSGGRTVRVAAYCTAIALIVLTCCLGARAVKSTSRRNVALGAHYRLTPVPNYPLALGLKGDELTDGRLAGRSFWRLGDSVGWQWESPILIQMSLDDSTPVDRVLLRAGRNTAAGIDYPSQAMVFLGNRDGLFEYIGDALGEDPANQPGSEETRFFALNFAPRRARSLAVVLYRSGALAFLDELEVWSAPVGSAVKGDIPEAMLLDRAATIRREYALMRGRPWPLGDAPSRLWAFPVNDDRGPSPMAASTSADCTIERIDPWADFEATALMKAPPPHDGLLVTIAGGHAVSAWRITNHGAEARAIGAYLEDGETRTDFLVAGFVQRLDFKWIADVMSPLREWFLPPQSAMVVMADIQPVKEGPFTTKVAVNCGPTVAQVAINGVAIGTADTAPRLHGLLWSYLHRPVTDALACDPDFHTRMWIDSAVVHPLALQPDHNEETERLLRSYFRAYRNVPRIMLFMNLRDTGTGGWGAVSNRVPELFEAWWQWIERIAREESISGEVLLYPFDEIRSNEVPILAQFRSASQRFAPGIRIFGTLDSASAAREYLDVAQMVDPTPAVDSMARGRSQELHIYAARPNGKARSAYSYYRLQAWQAYAFGVTGVGFWSLWESSGAADPQHDWTDFGGEEKDFGVLYAAPERCAWPSRRLLAWRRGLEDAKILATCQSRFEATKMLRLAASVVAGQDDLNAADAALAEVASQCKGPQ